MGAAVKIGSQAHHTSAISTSNETTIVVRGRNLAVELMGRISFTDHFWLLLTGAMPTAAQRRILDATLVAIAEHGLVPSVQVSRMTLAAAPEALQGAVAAGILGCGSVVLGSSEAAGNFYAAIAAQIAAGSPQAQAAQTVIVDYRTARRPIPGSTGTHIGIARQVESLLPALIGKPLKLNVSGAIPAVLLDAGYPLGALKGVPILARTAGLIAHLLEEQVRPIGFVLSHAGAAAIDYDGQTPPDFEPTHE
jgi:citrate synthase